MKIVSVASEAIPFAKTGGLGDVAGTLPLELQKLGHEVSVFLPRYKSIDPEKWGLKPVIDRMEIQLGGDKQTGRILRYDHPSGVQFYFVDQPEFFSRPEFYGTLLGDYPDNDRRFVFFQRAVLETLRSLNLRPHIIHCHDWQTGLIPAYIKTIYAKDFDKTKTVFTIHNLAYQGNFPPDSLPMTGLSWDQFKMEKLEFYGKVSFIKGGIVYSDLVTTVSPSYAEQIQTKEFGCGLEGVLAARALNIFGVTNGIDYKEWNPETDKDIASHYGAATLSKKQGNKHELQKENAFKVDSDIPVFGIVSRLVDQKGMDILIPVLQEIREWDIQFVLLGTGEDKYHQIFREIAKKTKGHFGIHILFDPKMAKRIYAGADMILVPSHYEPCGLAQMIALRYGTIPVVRATGGLADTVEEFDLKTGQGNGFRFDDYSPEAFLTALKNAIKIFKEKKSWETLMKNALASDYSWTHSAKRFVELFEEVQKKRS